MTVYYTGIGSRDTPEEVLLIMESAAFRLSRMGLVLRSGKAKGSDAAFQRGVQKYRGSHNLSFSTTGLAEIYIPWRGFCGEKDLIDDWDIPLDDIDKQYPCNEDLRWDWVKEVHGGWDKLSQGARKLHERNVHQLFGRNLSFAYLNQSKFVIYYSKETKSGTPTGGTATCVNLAKKQGIRTLNLLHKQNREVLEGFLLSMESKRGVVNINTPVLEQTFK